MSTPNSDRQNEETSRSSENIEIPPIPKQTAGAVAGAPIGSVAGPIGAIVGGVAGALAGKTTEKGRGVGQAGGRTLRKIVRKATSSKGPRSDNWPKGQATGRAILAPVLAAQ